MGVDDAAYAIEEVDGVAAAEPEAEGLVGVAFAPEQQQLAGFDDGAGLESAAVVVAVSVVVGECPVGDVDSGVAGVDQFDEVIALRVDLVDGDARRMLGCVRGGGADEQRTTGQQQRCRTCGSLLADVHGRSFSRGRGESSLRTPELY